MTVGALLVEGHISPQFMLLHITVTLAQRKSLEELSETTLKHDEFRFFVMTGRFRLTVGKEKNGEPQQKTIYNRFIKISQSESNNLFTSFEMPLSKTPQANVRSQVSAGFQRSLPLPPPLLSRENPDETSLQV